MTIALTAILAITLTVADGLIGALGRLCSQRERDEVRLIRALSDCAETLHRYGLLP